MIPNVTWKLADAQMMVVVTRIQKIQKNNRITSTLPAVTTSNRMMVIVVVVVMNDDGCYHDGDIGDKKILRDIMIFSHHILPLS